LRNQRLLPALCESLRNRKTLCHRLAGRDVAADDRFADRYVLHGLNRWSVEAASRYRRRNRYGSLVALVLVANKCVVGSIGDDLRGYRLHLFASRFEVG